MTSNSEIVLKISFSPLKLFLCGVCAGILVMGAPLVLFIGRAHTYALNGISSSAAVQPTKDVSDRPSKQAVRGGGCGSGGGCGGCGGGAKREVRQQNGIVQIDQESGIQVVKSIYTYNEDMVPNTFSVKKGIPVRFELDVKEDGQGCMSTVTIPGLYDQVDQLTANNKIIMEFTPTSAGEYPITCAMGISRGTIKVID